VSSGLREQAGQCLPLPPGVYPFADASAGGLHLNPNPGQSHRRPCPSVACGCERVGQEGAVPGWWAMMAERMGMVAKGYLVVIAFLYLHQLHPVDLKVAVVAGRGVALALGCGYWFL